MFNFRKEKKRKNFKLISKFIWFFFVIYEKGEKLLEFI